MSRPNGADYPEMDHLNPYFENGDTRSYTRQGGFLSLYTLPTFGATGPSGEASRALNTAASKLYYFVVHGNSRNTSYDKSDLMKAYMAFDGIVMMIEEAIRVYSFIRAQSVSNRWVKHIVQCLGWDYSDLTSKMVEFRKCINTAILKLNQISLPDVFDIAKCHAEMFRNVYYDRPSGKPQFIAQVSCACWLYSDKWSEMQAFTHGQLNGVSVVWNPALRARKVDDFDIIVNYAINQLYDSTDIGMMQGDLKRAFNEGQMISMNMIPEDLEIPLRYDAEFNLQIHNAEIFSWVSPYAVREPDTEWDQNLLATIRDNVSMDGNMMFMLGALPDMDSEASQTTRYYHVMDLTDEWNEDVDATILMQKFKHSTSIFTDVPVHSVEGSTVIRAAIPSSCGPGMIINARYFYDEKDLGQSFWYSSIVEIDASQSETIERLLKLFELGVTLLIYPSMNGKAYPTTWETQNVTVYGADVLTWIQNSMIESLWYNPALYNI